MFLCGSNSLIRGLLLFQKLSVSALASGQHLCCGHSHSRNTDSQRNGSVQILLHIHQYSTCTDSRQRDRPCRNHGSCRRFGRLHCKNIPLHLHLLCKRSLGFAQFLLKVCERFAFSAAHRQLFL